MSTRENIRLIARTPLPLHIETGRFARSKLPVEQRNCFHCIDSVEDELHFLLL